MRKRKCLAVVALGLALVFAMTALAEGRLLTMWNAGAQLLFETSNVTLTGEATFTYDGQEFKQFTGVYRQDGNDTFMQAMFDTPRNDGTVYTGGYTVVSNDGVAYSMNTDTPLFYQPSNASTKESILTNTVMRTSLTRFGGLLLDMMEERMEDAITQEENEAGTLYNIRLQKGQAPEIANAATTLLVQIAAKEYFFIDPEDAKWMFEPSDNALNIAWEDWEASMATLYEKTYGVPLPENYYDLLWDEEGNPLPEQDRYDEISAKMSEMAQNVQNQYETGVAVIYEDLTVKHYETQDAYIVAEGHQEVFFDNHSAAIHSYYEKLTGTPLTVEMLEASARNEQVNDAMYDMTLQMTEMYADIAREAGASGILVHADGSYSLTNDVRALSKTMHLSTMTPTRRIMYTMREMSIDNTDVSVQLDKQGRVLCVQGDVTLLVLDHTGSEHELVINFKGTAGAYGESTVEAFDPADYNVISYRDYYNGNYDPAMFETVEEEATEIELPATIIFNGVEYDLTETGDESGTNG